MCLPLSAADLPLYFINVYVPQSGISSHEKKKYIFYEKLENLHNQFPHSYLKFIIGNFNIYLNNKYNHKFMFGPHVFARGRDYLNGINDQIMENRRFFLNFALNLTYI